MGSVAVHGVCIQHDDSGDFVTNLDDDFGKRLVVHGLVHWECHMRRVREIHEGESGLPRKLSKIAYWLLGQPDGCILFVSGTYPDSEEVANCWKPMELLEHASTEIVEQSRCMKRPGCLLGIADLLAMVYLCFHLHYSMILTPHWAFYCTLWEASEAVDCPPMEY